MKHIITLILLCSTLLLAKEFNLTQQEIEQINKLPQSSFIFKRFKALEDLKQEVKTEQTMKKLVKINLFFNQSLPVHDETKYQTDDYWATRKEFLINGKGDCEDYVIAKYLTLIETGIPKKNLYLAVVQVKKNTSYHMILLYNDSKSKNLYVLDNLSFRILPLQKRVDLIPIVAFNEFESRELKESSLGKNVNIDWGKTNKWEELLERIYSKNE